MTAIISETRERLLVAIAAQVPPERIVEIHFFAPIKQGGVESGVAVVAAKREQPAPEAPVEEVPVDEVPVDEAPVDEAPVEPATVDEATPVDEAPSASDTERHVVYTARYRLTLKGPDRGKWETNIVAEADAPLVTVDVVVRGVQRRVGDLDEPERMTGEDVRAILDARNERLAAGTISHP